MTPPEQQAAAKLKELAASCAGDLYSNAHEYNRNGEYTFRGHLAVPILLKFLADSQQVMGTGEALGNAAIALLDCAGQFKNHGMIASYDVAKVYASDTRTALTYSRALAGLVEGKTLP